QAVFIDSIPILLIVGIIFFLLLFLIVKQIWKSIYRPLNNLEQLANDISKGHYKQLNIERQDEIGNLTRAFNEMSESLAEQEERKKEFIANVVHELRTPLTYVRGYVEALRDKYFTSREDANHYLNTIEKETERISKLINDLEDLMHLQENLFSVDLQPIVISQILYDTLDLFRIHRSEKNL